jgi:hypothetical protein
MKKVVFLFALCFALFLSVSVSHDSAGFVKAKTEQRDALVNAQSADYL